MSPTALASTTSTSVISRHLIPDLPSADEVVPYLRRIDEIRWYSNFGPLVCEFEEKLGRLLSRADRTPDQGQIHLTSLVSGHYALEVALRILGLCPGKRVLLPAVTFPACPLAVQHTGAEAVLADVDPVEWTLTPQVARAAAQHVKIDAVMPVATYGVPIPTAPWDEFSRDTGIPIVIDAAAAVEVQQIPGHGLVAHSLHATKPFGIGEGGILAGRDDSFIKRSRRYTNFGTTDRICHMDGANAKMSEYHAAVGLAQISRWSGIKQRRRELLLTYLRHLEPLADFLSLQPALETAVVSSLMLMLKRAGADSVLAKTAARGLATHRTYLPPLYRHPHFGNVAVSDVDGRIVSGRADVEIKKRHMAGSEKLLACLIGVPFHPFMSEADVVAVVNEVSKQLPHA